MNLTLTDVSGLSIDARAAKLRTGTIIIHTDGATRLVIDRLQAGTAVYEKRRRVARANRSGTAVVRLRAGRTVLVLRAPTMVYSCTRPTGRLSGLQLGPLRLGMTRPQARRLFARHALRGRRYMDFFCPQRRGIRVGYATPLLLSALPSSQRAAYSDRVVLALTASYRFTLDGVRPGTPLVVAERRLRVGPDYQVGLNGWYLVTGRLSHGVFKVRHGVIQEIGIADKRLTATSEDALLFFTSFY